MSELRQPVCYLCGIPQSIRGRVLTDHIKKCTRLWRAEENEKPQPNRRPLPTEPSLPQPDEHTTTADLALYNSEAQRIWKTQSLEACPTCGKSMHAKGAHHAIRPRAARCALRAARCPNNTVLTTGARAHRQRWHTT